MGGDLIRKMRKGEEKIRKLTGDTVRLVERAGTPIESLLIRKDPWAKDRCLGIGCEICMKEGSSICKKKSIVYKHECLICLEEERSSIYWGQSSKSLKEIAL